MKKKFVDKENTRTLEQRSVYEQIETEGVDPFEFEYFKAHHPNPILFENNSWLITKNAFPYIGTSLHLLFVHREFITSVEEISGEGWSDLQSAIKFAVEEFKLKSGGFFMRFGDTTKTGATVTHLHAHITVTDGSEFERRSMYIAVS